MSEDNKDSKDRIVSAARSKLPIASVIPDSDVFKQAVKLLRESTTVVSKISELEERKGEIVTELAAICEAFELPGIKHGRNGFQYHGYKTRKNLSVDWCKQKLLAAGVGADEIEAAYKESAPYLDARITPFDID
jgi:hypothetical protein